MVAPPKSVQASPLMSTRWAHASRSNTPACTGKPSTLLHHELECITPPITALISARTPTTRPTSSFELAPLAPTRQIVAEVKQWKDSYRREPLLTHFTITGLTKVHEEWEREMAAQKGLLHVHLTAALERLERLERSEYGRLQYLKQLEQHLQAYDGEISELKKLLDDSELDRVRIRSQLQVVRKSGARR